MNRIDQLIDAALNRAIHDETSHLIYGERFHKTWWDGDTIRYQQFDNVYHDLGVPSMNETFCFSKAMALAEQGYKVRAVKWGADQYYTITNRCIYDEMGNVKSIRADAPTLDWEVYDAFHHDYEWALEQYNLGKKVARREWRSTIRQDTPHTSNMMPTFADQAAKDWGVFE